MTPPTAEIFHGDPVPIPVERFSQDGGRADGIVRRMLGRLAEHAASELGDEELSEAFSSRLGGGSPTRTRASTPPGVIPERHALNARVEAFMRENDVDFDTALREVTGQVPKGVDLDREQMNQAVEAHMARTGCDINEAIRHVESMTAAAPPSAGAVPGQKPSGADEADLKRERKLLNTYLERNPSATLAEATAAVAKSMEGN